MTNLWETNDTFRSGHNLCTHVQIEWRVIQSKENEVLCDDGLRP